MWFVMTVSNGNRGKKIPLLTKTIVDKNNLRLSWASSGVVLVVMYLYFLEQIQCLLNGPWQTSLCQINCPEFRFVKYWCQNNHHEVVMFPIKLKINQNTYFSLYKFIFFLCWELIYLSIYFLPPINKMLYDSWIRLMSSNIIFKNSNISTQQMVFITVYLIRLIKCIFYSIMYIYIFKKQSC